MEEALKKLIDEIKAEEKNEYVQYVGKYLIDYVESHPEHADLILDDKKTIKGSLEHMRQIASKKQSNRMAMLTPSEGFEAVLDYYGIKGNSTEVMTPKTETTKKKINISLDDLL